MKPGSFAMSFTNLPDHFHSRKVNFHFDCVDVVEMSAPLWRMEEKEVATQEQASFFKVLNLFLILLVQFHIHLQTSA